ncbi:MAG: EF-P beta-lysylation protein EpmB [Legionellales bacterium]|nr:EF-P beta-lysylation protein EpmB [Legionellales bacterium]
MNYSSWQSILANSATNIQDILNEFKLNINDFYDKPIEIDNFRIKVPYTFLKKIVPGDPNDPILKQILPSQSELVKLKNYHYDQLLENQSNPTPGILHKFKGRVIVTMTGNCAIHCRYCFRRYFDYKSNIPNKKKWNEIKLYLTENSDIFEVFLSGGDPLLNNDTYLGDFINMLTTVPNITTLRIHSRIPIVLPERITQNFLRILQGNNLIKVMVVHANHPQELDEQIQQKIQLLRNAGLTVFNQSVLLSNINNDPDVLIKLSKKLFSYNILPYYLHMLDQVIGSQKFYVDKKDAQDIYHKLLINLPGYLVPKLVKESAKSPYKIPIFY